MRKLILSTFFLFNILLWPSHLLAASSFEAGFKTLGIWEEDTQIRLDLNIWYPTYARPTYVDYIPWTLHVVPYGRAAKGRFPLLLLSHDSTATRFSYHETAARLAKSGFVVIAPAHKNDNMHHISNPFSLSQLTERATDLGIALNIALSNEAISKSIDPMRIGVLGFGTGASAALLLGNANPTPNLWENFCPQANRASVYCSSWVQGRIQSMVDFLPLNKNFALNQVTAIAAIAPSFGMLFDKIALQQFKPKLLLIEAEKDNVNLIPWNTESLIKNFPTTPEFIQIKGVDVEDLQSICPPSLRDTLAELCGKAAADIKYDANYMLNKALLKFFLQNLGHVGNNHE